MDNFNKMNTIMDRDLMSEAVRLAEGHVTYLHNVPERAFEEYKTTEYISKVCRNYPLNIIDIGMETGLVCYLDAGAADTVALRADIDAVPTEYGQDHLCGHDAHTASMLGAIHYICNRGNRFGRTRLNHNVLFIFQPAEEGTHGARAMLGSGLLEKVPQRPSMIFGIHNRPEADCGDIIVHKGALMSEKSVFTVRYIGKAGHGSLPHKCIDPIVAAGSFISSVPSIVSRNTDPFTPAICTVNSIWAGEPDNSAPETAVMTGYIRSLSHDTQLRMEERLRALAEGTARSYECSCELRITPMVSAVVNSDEMYKYAYRAAAAVVGQEHIIDSRPSLASEDFSVFGEVMPSFLYWVGSGTPGRENAPWHDPEFCIGAEYFRTAVPLLCAAAME